MRIFTSITLVLLLLNFAPLAQAQNAENNQPPKATIDPPNREVLAKLHRQMADIHTKMADCLASTRPINECQQQMSTSCSSMQGMMGKGMGWGRHEMMGQGMMGRGMMNGLAGCPDERIGKIGKRH